MRIGVTDRGRPFNLPAAAVTHTFGILAKRRAGKSYTAAVMSEEFAGAKIPFVVLDPTGAWWGLRASADGQRAGLPVIILGGAHGDVPLEPTGGRLVADLVVDHPGFYVLDLEAFESNAAQDRFVTEFAVRLYRRKATHRDPLHLFIDEADSFVPQRPGASQLPMLGAFESIVRRGGIRGLGTTLISQRAAVVNKNVLTQLDTLIVLQTTGPQDQDAELDWVKRNASPDQYALFRDSLASLPRGTAWVYSPELGVFERVAIRARKTFNSSATPEMGEAVIEPRKLAAVDLDAVRSAMAATIERHRADDPKVLRARIAELERLTREGQKPVFEKAVEVRVEVPVLTEEGRRAISEAVAAVDRGAQALSQALAGVGAIIEQANAMLLATPATSRAPAIPDRDPFVYSTAPANVVAEARARTERARAQVAEPPNGEVRIGKAEQAILSALATHRAGLTRKQMSLITGYAATAGHTSNVLGRLRSGGLITRGEPMTITDEGVVAVGDYETPPHPGPELVEWWMNRLGKAERAILAVYVARYPNAVSKDEISAETGYAPTAGHTSNTLGRLRTLGLVNGNTASTELMGA